MAGYATFQGFALALPDLHWLNLVALRRLTLTVCRSS